MPAMDIAREISGANFLESTPPGFTGEGVRGEVMEIAGVLETHDAFQHPDPNAYPMLHCLNFGSDLDHGTKVYGIVFGDGTGSPISGAKGILPEGEGLFLSWSYLGTHDCDDPYLFCGSRDETAGELVGAACCCANNPDCPYNAVFQTNSWGHVPFTAYSTYAAEMDDIASKYDLLICQAQGNYGATQDPRDSFAQAWAKNVVSVGGFKHYDTLCEADDNWCGQCPPPLGKCDPSPEQLCALGCASRGFAEDGRVKPDLVHFYDNILTTCYDNDSCYTDNDPVPPLRWYERGHADHVWVCWSALPDVARASILRIRWGRLGL
jgi:hypothetical protein